MSSRGQPNDSDEHGIPWERYISAGLRYKWLILLLTLLGTAAGFAAGRLSKPEYQAAATIWIAERAATGRDRGPIRAEELLSMRAWPELMRSFAILDKVVLRQRLFLEVVNPADSALIADFQITDRIRPGEYELRVGANGRLSLLNSDRELVDTGMVGDSLGRQIGIRWIPQPATADAGRAVRFHVRSVRDASVTLRQRLDVNIGDRTNLLGVTLRGDAPGEIASTLDAVLEQFVSTAAELKKRSLVENAGILGEQLAYAYGELQAAEVEYETFRVHTITLPSEGIAVAAGVDITRDPVFSSFFEQRIEADRLHRDLGSLNRFLVTDSMRPGDLNVLWGIPSVQRFGEKLRTALSEFTTREAALRSLRAIYTDEHPDVREAQRVLESMRAQVILPLIVALADQLRVREQELTERLGSTSRELRQIPQRTIEEMRLRRNVAVRENLYTLLKNRFEEARLAEAASIPDVSILDRAGAPRTPTDHTTPHVILMGTAAGLGAALVLILFLDRIDPRVRHLEQITRDMRLGILGAIPTLSKKGGKEDAHEAMQVVEAFRSIRLSLFHALGGQHPIQFAVTSPSIGDGKSLVSANLALSFAEAGYSTVLVDGDIRRGSLHSMFATARRPGLPDHLAGDASLDAVLQPTSHRNLTLLASGTRSRRAPELLMSPALSRLMSALRGRFHVIIIDSPPLGASIDPFALGSAAENMVLVVRSGETDRKLAMAKLEIVDRLPIRLVGVVLNAISASGTYKYYSYLDGYSIENEDEVTAPAAGSGARWPRDLSSTLR